MATKCSVMSVFSRVSVQRKSTRFDENPGGRITCQQLALHEDIKALRNEVFAHSQADRHRVREEYVQACDASAIRADHPHLPLGEQQLRMLQGMIRKMLEVVVAQTNAVSARDAV